MCIKKFSRKLATTPYSVNSISEVSYGFLENCNRHRLYDNRHVRIWKRMKASCASSRVPQHVPLNVYLRNMCHRP